MQAEHSVAAAVVLGDILRVVTNIELAMVQQAANSQVVGGAAVTAAGID